MQRLYMCLASRHVFLEQREIPTLGKRVAGQCRAASLFSLMNKGSLQAPIFLYSRNSDLHRGRGRVVIQWRSCRLSAVSAILNCRNAWNSRHEIDSQTLLKRNGFPSRSSTAKDAKRATIANSGTRILSGRRTPGQSSKKTRSAMEAVVNPVDRAGIVCIVHCAAPKPGGVKNQGNACPAYLPPMHRGKARKSHTPQHTTLEFSTSELRSIGSWIAGARPSHQHTDDLVFSQHVTIKSFVLHGMVSPNHIGTNHRAMFGVRSFSWELQMDLLCSSL
jgi:hypothetical protein